MAINFPDAPTTGQMFTPGRRFKYAGSSTWDSDDYSPLFRNRIVNPNMTVSQEFGQGGVTGYVAAGGGCPADQWTVYYNMAAGAQCLGHSYNPGVSEGGGGPHPGNAIVGYAQAAYAFATDGYLHIYQFIEGNRVADFLWGTVNARPVVLRFMCMAHTTGTYMATMKNAAQDRYYITPFTVTAADTWQEFIFAIPGDTTGNYPTDSAYAILLSFGSWAFGTTYASGAERTWSAGNKYSTSGCANWTAGGAGYFRIARVGLYLDPFGTGVAPLWVEPQYAEQEMLSMRYWYRAWCLRGVVSNTATVSRLGASHPVQMRATPAVAMKGAVPVYSGRAGNATASVAANYSNSNYCEIEISSTGFTSGDVICTYVSTPDTNYFSVNAR